MYLMAMSRFYLEVNEIIDLDPASKLKEILGHIFVMSKQFKEETMISHY